MVPGREQQAVLICQQFSDVDLLFRLEGQYVTGDRRSGWWEESDRVGIEHMSIWVTDCVPVLNPVLLHDDKMAVLGSDVAGRFMFDFSCIAVSVHVCHRQTGIVCIL